MKIRSLSQEEFDNYASNHKYESLYQTSSYAEFRSLSSVYKANYLGFYDNNNEIVGATMIIYKTLFWGYKYGYAPRGFLIDYMNEGLVNSVTNALKKLLYKQKFIFIKIDPPVVASERDKTGKSMYVSDTINDILKTLKNNDYHHMGFNLYNETILSRWNVFSKLINDDKELFNSFDKNIQDDIVLSQKRGCQIIEDEELNIDNFYNLIKDKYNKKSSAFFSRICETYKKSNNIRIFYGFLDTNYFTKNAKKLYDNELERNKKFINIIETGDNVKYNMSKVINDKIDSDKLLHKFKADTLNAANLLNKYPDGLVTNACMVITHGKGITILVNYFDKTHLDYNCNGLMIYEIMKKFADNYQYINLGAVTGNFDSSKKSYQILADKVGFNSSIIEYIGEFDLVINPMMYKIYLKKSQKEKLI